MKYLKSHQTILTEDAVIKELFERSIVIKSGATLTVKGQKNKTSYTACLVRVETGGTLIIEDDADLTHICVEGGKVIVKGRCFYIYHKGGEVVVDDGHVSWLEFRDMLDGGYDDSRNLVVTHGGHIERLSCGSKGSIYVDNSSIHDIAIDNAIVLNLKSATIEEGYIENGIIVRMDYKVNIDKKVEISDYARELDADDCTEPLTYDQATRRLHRVS